MEIEIVAFVRNKSEISVTRRGKIFKCSRKALNDSQFMIMVQGLYEARLTIRGDKARDIVVIAEV